MVKTLKVRKGPSDSAIKFKLGTKKKGADGNVWKIGINKNGIKRWIKLSKNTTKIKRHRRIIQRASAESIWGKNKNLEKFWRKLASGSKVILVYATGKISEYTLPKTQPAKKNKYIELENNRNIKAIITSAMSSDSYEAFYKRVNNKTPEDIIKNYKKYLLNYGKGDKNWYL